MSHELRTPLNAILGFTDLLTEQLSDTVHDDQRRYLRNVGQAGQHLLGLINDLLDLAKVEAGRIELRPEVIRLESLMEPTIAATRSLAAAKSIQFVTNDLPDTSVRVDPARVRQVLYNLLSNAVKFTPEGGRVTLRADVHAGALVIEVHDTGVGIPLEHRDRLFMAFERFHEGVVDAPGAGLGLAVTKRLVELHHGTIDVESTIGVGTTFRVRLFDVAVSSINGHRILIVDDVASDADLISTIAAEMGLRSEIVGTAAAAVEAVERDAPAAIVLDYRLPDGRGEAVLRHVKANRSTAKIPVIVVTVEDDDGRSRPLGADDHLTKPIDRRRLEAWLQIITPERNEVVAP